MATVERYSSFEEIKTSEPASRKKKKSLKETVGQKLFREFGTLLRKGITSTSPSKK